LLGRCSVDSRAVPFNLDGDLVGIDCRMGGLDGIVAAYVVPGENGVAVIETGPATVAATLTEALASMGIGPSDVAYFVGSHIHLDHAGGAGDLVDVFPSATIVVHREGARHMVDPAKLMASAYRVFGPRLDELFGPLRPVPADRLRAVDDGDRLDLGRGRSLEIVYAPGHARHHMGVLDSETGVLFVGDSMGVYLPEAGVLRPATPPPDFDLELALKSLERYRSLSPSGLYLTHFGPAPADRDLLAEAAERLVRFGEIVREAMKESEDLDFITDRLVEKTRDDYAVVWNDPELLKKFESLNAFRSSAAGYLRYFQTSGAASK
jgi:glyoxylase-like metal-dependent hydrolase (beta-lactamase superfamily II)